MAANARNGRICRALRGESDRFVGFARAPTDQDLKDLGIVLGDRRKLLRAIRELDAPAPAAAADAAERRPLTLMFCDWVGSTTLSASLDPEDLRAVINAYHRCCAQAVQRHGGFITKYIGDLVRRSISAIRKRANITPSMRFERSAGPRRGGAQACDTRRLLILISRSSSPAGMVVVGDIRRVRTAPRSAAWWARRPTLPRGCRRSPSRMRW